MAAASAFYNCLIKSFIYEIVTSLLDEIIVIYVKSVGTVASADQVLLQTERARTMAIIISRYVTEGAFTIALIKYDKN